MIDMARIRQLVAELQVAVTDIPVPATNTTFKLKPGDDLQKALNAAQPGDVIRLAPGDYRGNYVLPKKAILPTLANLLLPITVRSDVADSTLPVEGRRITPEFEPAMPRIISADGINNAVYAAPGSGGWLFFGVTFPPMTKADRTLVQLGAASNADPKLTPVGFTFDRCYFYGDPVAGQHKAIDAQCIGFTLLNSYLHRFTEVARDSQCVCSYNAPGPFLLENNFFEASGENVLFGGGRSSLRSLVPMDIVVRGNLFSKNPDWRSWAKPPATKNHFELKSGVRALIENNVFEHDWKMDQTGMSIMFKTAYTGELNPDGTKGDWVETSDVLFQYNVIRKVCGVFSINNADAGVTKGTHGLKIRHNLAYDLNQTYLGGENRVFKITQTPYDIDIDHNTIVGNAMNSALTLDAVVKQLRLTNNILPEGNYGIAGANLAPGLPSWTALAPDGTFTGNALEKGSRTIPYPAGNLRYAGPTRDMLDSDFRVRPGTPLATLPGIGADIDEIKRRIPWLTW